MQHKENCWEFNKCNRVPGKDCACGLDVCPTALDKSKDSINNGNAAGRCCWRAAGTLCGGKVQGTLARKLESCEECPFFQKVRDEEGNFFYQ